MREVTSLIDELLWDRRYLAIPDEIESPHGLFIVRDLSVRNRNLYNTYRARLEADAIRNGVQTEEEIIGHAMNNGVWSENDQLLHESLSDHIAFLEGEASQQTTRVRKRRIQRQVDEAKNKLAELQILRSNLTINSAEYFAHEASILKLIPLLVRDENDKKLWRTDQEFLAFKQEYPSLIVFLGSDILGGGVLPTAEYRRIARATEWRILWISQREAIHGLFGRSAGELNIRQLMLIYWSRVYDQVFEDPKCPDREIIDNDEKLDDWLSNKNLEQEEIKKAERKNSKHKSVSDHHENMQVLDGEYIDTCTCGVGTGRKAGLGLAPQHDPSCMYGVWREFSQEEKDELADRFYGRNQKGIRNLINREMEIVSEKGVVQEQHLRGKRSRQLLGSAHKVIPVKK